jgi:hypothetical protein
MVRGVSGDIAGAAARRELGGLTAVYENRRQVPAREPGDRAPRRAELRQRRGDVLVVPGGVHDRAAGHGEHRLDAGDVLVAGG